MGARLPVRTVNPAGTSRGDGPPPGYPPPRRWTTAGRRNLPARPPGRAGAPPRPCRRRCLGAGATPGRDGDRHAALQGVGDLRGMIRPLPRLHSRLCIRVPVHALTSCVPGPGQSNPCDVQARAKPGLTGSSLPGYVGETAPDHAGTQAEITGREKASKGISGRPGPRYPSGEKKVRTVVHDGHHPRMPRSPIRASITSPQAACVSAKIAKARGSSMTTSSGGVRSTRSRMQG